MVAPRLAPGTGAESHLVDADGCELTVGLTTWEPWRWGQAVGLRDRTKCRVSRGVRMRDPETHECLPRYHELAIEV